MIDLLIALVFGYLLGSIPFGLVLTHLGGAGDIRSIGSGNIGATNVLRTGRKGLAAATLLLDGGKGAAAVLLASAFLSPDSVVVAAGLAAVFGHNFPVWLGFKGGKGVATSLGMLLAVAWPVGIAACLTWLAVAAVTRYSSLSALLALGLAPVYAAIWSGNAVICAAVILALLSIIRHRANIARLLKGEEPRIGRR